MSIVSRKRWMKHGDDEHVMRAHKSYGLPYEWGLLPVPMGRFTVRPGDWICTDHAGVKSVETDPAIVTDLNGFADKATGRPVEASADSESQGGSR